MALRALDVTDWGFFRFAGPDARDFLQGLLTADLRLLKPGEPLSSCLLTPKGRLTADLELYDEGPGLTLAVVRPAAAEGFFKAFEKKITLSKSRLERRRSPTWLVLGEGFARGLPWTRMGPGRLLMGVGDPPVDTHLLSADEFHAARIAAGFPWYGVDMDENSLPLEVRQEAGISIDKGCYMGQETVSRLHHMGHVNRILVGLETDAPAGAAVGADGKLTSSAGGLALAMVRAADSKPGTVLDVGGTRAVVRDLPWPQPLTRIGKD